MQGDGMMKKPLSTVFAYSDQFLEALPGIEECLHGEPSVRISSHVQRFNTIIRSFQFIEIVTSFFENCLESIVSIDQSLCMKRWMIMETPRGARRTRISSKELHFTGSVRSSSAFSNQELKADAFFANRKNSSSMLRKRSSAFFSFSRLDPLVCNSFCQLKHFHQSAIQGSSQQHLLAQDQIITGLNLLFLFRWASATTVRG